MNVDKFLKFFVPKNHSFFPLFESDARNLVRAAELLKELMDHTDSNEHERINREIKEIEHIGDEITTRTYEQLNKSFITPLDREDIHELTANLDDVVDSINGISRRICLYKPARLLPAYQQLAAMILEGALELEKAVSCLKDPSANKNKIMAACERVKDIEHRADDIYFEGASQLFQTETNPRELLKNNKILEILERCVDEEEDVADILKTILVKTA